MFPELDQVIQEFCHQFPAGTFLHYPFNLIGLIAITLVSLVCGGVGSLVVGNRMAFFSDALAHCAFAGVGLGLLLGLVTGTSTEQFKVWVPLVMVALGVVFGLSIAFVREKTGQASDTIIGVFFAGAIGLGAIFLKMGSARQYIPPEDFLFGNLVSVTLLDVFLLAGLVLLTAGVVGFLYNRLVFASFSRSLATSRRIPVVALNYLFICLLAVVVNLCLMIVGALLINALLIVPAAAAANVSRNMRQLFWTSIGICLAVGVLGQYLSWVIKLPGGQAPGEGGTIVLLSVLVFFASMVIGPALQRRRAAR